MAARDPPPPLSIGVYPQEAGSGGSMDPYRTRGRNSSAASSGASSREPSVEGRRGDNRRGLEVRGNGDFGASSQYQGPVLEQNRRTSNWGYTKDRGKNKDLYWRDDSRGVHGRVQGVFYDDDSPKGSSGSSIRGYSLTIGGEGLGRRVSSAHQRQENSYSGNRRQSNGYGRQENGQPRGQGEANSDNGFVGPGGYPRASQSGSYRGRSPSLGGSGSSRVLPRMDLGVSKDVVFGDGRDLRALGSPASLSRSKEVVFGFSRELETFGSPVKNLSRKVHSPGSFLPPTGDPKRHWAKNDPDNGRDVEGSAVRGLKEGDPRKRFADESISQGDAWRTSSSTSSNGSKNSNRESTRTPILKKEFNVDTYIMDGYERGSSYDRNNSIESGSDFSGELALLSRISSSKETFSRESTYNRVKKHVVPAQLPVFSPSSQAKADIKRDTNVYKHFRESPLKLSRESSISESASTDFGLDGNKGWNAANQFPGKALESASAEKHKTRSTDWYEICLKEEEEEEMQALARKLDEQSKLGSSKKPTHVGVGDFSRPSSSHQSQGEYAVFSPSLIPEGKHRETKNLEKRWSKEGLVRGEAADSAQPNFSSGKRNANAGWTQRLFTPWNALRAAPASRKVSLSVPKSRPGEQPGDSSGKHENLRVSIAGGRQEARGRRTGSAIDEDEAENWRAERRPSRDYSREVVLRSDPPREVRTGTFLRRAKPKQTNGREAALLASVAETEMGVPEVF